VLWVYNTRRRQPLAAALITRAPVFLTISFFKFKIRVSSYLFRFHLFSSIRAIFRPAAAVHQTTEGGWSLARSDACDVAARRTRVGSRRGGSNTYTGAASPERQTRVCLVREGFCTHAPTGCLPRLSDSSAAFATWALIVFIFTKWRHTRLILVTSFCSRVRFALK
jgi:hypothetical protein